MLSLHSLLQHRSGGVRKRTPPYVAGLNGSAEDAGHVNDYTDKPCLNSSPDYSMKEKTMDRHNIRISFNSIHPTSDLSELCEALGVKPEILWKKGDEKRTPKGNIIGGIRENSRCLISFSPFPRNTLSEQLMSILDNFKSHRTLLYNLSNSGGTHNFFVGIFYSENTVETFSLKLFELLLELRIELVLDLYPRD